MNRESAAKGAQHLQEKLSDMEATLRSYGHEMYIVGMAPEGGEREVREVGLATVWGEREGYLLARSEWLDGSRLKYRNVKLWFPENYPFGNKAQGKARRGAAGEVLGRTAEDNSMGR